MDGAGGTIDPGALYFIKLEDKSLNITEIYDLNGIVSNTRDNIPEEARLKSKLGGW